MTLGASKLIDKLLRRKPKATGYMTLQATIIRADGTVEDLGVISRGPITFTPEKGK